MSPKKRARKSDPAPSAAAGEPRPKAPLPPDANTGVVFTLPTEIWLEILSYLPSVRIPTLRISSSPVLPASTLARQQGLRALSQTCRQFRTLFLPQLWDRFEVCATKRQQETPLHHSNDVQGMEGVFVSGAWYKSIAEALETRSNGLRNSPEHAKLVHKVSVALTRCQSGTVLPAFVRCLMALPNLDTLQVLRAHTQMTTHLKDAFEGHVIRQVRTVVLPDHAHNVLRSCPEVRSVVCNCGDGGKLVSAIQKECKKVEKLAGFGPDEKMMKRLVKAVPNLQEIHLSSLRMELKTIGMLGSLKHLRVIELDIPASSTPENTKCIGLAKELLRKARDRGVQKTCLRLRHLSASGSGSRVEELEITGP
ncbi:hypothetical protein DXG01_009485 [Tephrocybe rancida]|nr:hypothetical protein DXG01_009485 [Tephrocybe rancida]